jgi:N-acetyl-anhydromuramyl-L-alanine amidase AmpD
VGYHVVIQGDGTTQYGRPIGKVPAANLGLNTESYAICLEGNFQPGSPGYCGQEPTKQQIQALVNIIHGVKPKLPNLRYLIGHRDVARIVANSDDATACPGDSLYALLPNVRDAVGLSAR